jgi:hypothetical protein
MRIDFNTITLLIGAGSLVLLLMELRSNHVWNQKRSSYELMNDMITSGRFTGAMELIEREFGWNVLTDPRSYAEVAGAVADPAQRAVLDRQLVTLLRHLEMLSISIHHGIVSEAISREGFKSFFPRIYHAALPFIAQERERRGNPQIYVWFERYALRWERAGEAE